MSSFPHGADFETRVHQVLADSSRFWLACQLAPLTIGLLVLVVAWKRLLRGVGWSYALLLPILYFAYPPVWSYGFMFLANDSFSLPLGMGLFAAFGAALSRNGSAADKWWLLSGAISGADYLNKLNYLAWPAGMLCGYLLSALLLREHIAGVLRHIATYVGGFLLTVLGIGGGYLGWNGLKAMYAAHVGYLMHTGLYGTGNAGMADHRMMLHSLYDSIATYWLFWLVLCVIIVQIALIVRARKQDGAWLRRQMPMLASTSCAALAAALAAFKHYSPHYLIPLVIIAVYWAWWAGSCAVQKYQKVILIPFAMLAFLNAFQLNVRGQVNANEKAHDIAGEVAQVKALPLVGGETRLWSYHVSAIEYMQYFMTTLAESPYLSNLIEVSSGQDQQYSIFGDPAQQDETLESGPWRYAVFDVTYFKQADKLPRYFQTHGNVIARFDHLMVVERRQSGVGVR
jgi:hypothetical protein